MTSRPQALRGLFLSFLLPLFSTLAAAQPASLVKDHNSTRTGGTIDTLLRTSYTPLGSLVLFQADDGRHGDELWRTDGTEAGTTLLADICPGVCPSRIYWKAVAGSQMFFVADDGAHGLELWATDGTTAGTRLVADLIPGLTGSNPFELLPLGNKVLFSTHSGVDSNIVDGELWISDGTAAGTTLIADIWPGPAPSYPAFLGKIGSTVLFSAATFSEGRELWRTDGTPGGTSRITDVNPGSGGFLPDQNPPFPRARYAVASGSKVFFAADDGTHGSELWASDGTAAGTILLKDIHPSSDSIPSHLVPFGSGVVFNANDGTNGQEVWISDGTPAGTGLLADINPGVNGSNPFDMTVGGGRVWFRADDGVHGRELWSTNGTGAGTAMVADVFPGMVSGFSTLYPPTGYLAPNLLFFVDDGVHGVEPWKTDGTAAGTSLLADIQTGPSNSSFFNGPSDGEEPAVAGGLIYFTAFTSSRGFEVWVSDGTPAGTRKLKEINDQASSFFVIPYVGTLAGPRPLSNLGSTLFFGADDGAAQFELRKSDGTAAGTVKVSNGTPGTVAFCPVSFLPLGGALLFSGEDGTHGSELWRTDGTSAGTFMVKDLDPASFSNGSPHWFAPLGSKIAFAGPNSGLWTSDGTNAGTQPVGAPVFVGGPPIPFAGALFFSGASSGPTATGGELFRTDGTLAGTSLVLDIRPGDPGSYPSNLTVVGGTLYFAAETGTAGRELWKSNGTAAGTVQVKDIRPGIGYGAASNYSNDDIDLGYFWATLGGKLLFQANDGVTGEELWTSDGSAAGTQPIADLFPGAQGSEPRWITAAAGRVFFVADDGVHGRELWVTDGTPGGTALLADIAAGSGSSQPAELRAVGRVLLFSAWDAAHGRELWVSDGTAAGTKRVQEIAPGAFCASPMAMTAVGPQVYFVANDNTTGFELWKLPKASLGSALSATKTVSGFYYAGGTVIYTIVLRNDGLTLQPDAAGAELTDVLPAGLALTGATATAGSVGTNVGTRTVTWNGVLNAGATVTLTITATVQGATPVSALANQATLAWDADADGVNEANGVSDDPGAAGGNDPTSITVGQPLGFYTVTPCRVVDTRSSTPLAFGVKRTFNVAGSCGVPSSARAVAANLTIVDGTAAGTLVVWTASQPIPGTSNLNFNVGTVRGNNAILGLGGGAIDAQAMGTSGTVQLIVDISGYFQ